MRRFETDFLCRLRLALKRLTFSRSRFFSQPKAGSVIRRRLAPQKPAGLRIRLDAMSEIVKY